MDKIADIPKRYPLRLWLVVAAYILFWPALRLYQGGADDCFLAVSIAAMASSLTLLGIWAGLSAIDVNLRILRVGLWIIYLAAASVLVASASPDPIAALVLSVLSSVPVTAIAVTLGMSGATTCCPGEVDERNPTRGFQYSLRILMIIAILVAILLAAAKSYREYRWESILFGMAVISLIAMAPALAWAGLGHGSPLPRAAVVALFGACIGSILAFAADAWYLNWPAIGVLYSLGVVGPLLVVRSMGFRLVRPYSGRTTDNPRQ
jgi:hypothetical protein